MDSERPCNDVTQTPKGLVVYIIMYPAYVFLRGQNWGSEKGVTQLEQGSVYLDKNPPILLLELREAIRCGLSM